MASMEMDVYLNGTEEEKEADASKIRDLAMEFFDGQKEAGNLPAESYCMTSVRYELYESFYSLFGGILFLGIFLGLLFLMGAAMIIYYKQVSEGYEDKDRFEIMQKVGMTHKEVKSSIHRQILMVFFLPLGMAALHIAMAFPMVGKKTVGAVQHDQYWSVCRMYGDYHSGICCDLWNYLRAYSQNLL